MAVDFLKLEVYDIAVQKILPSVATFKFIELIPVQKSSLVYNLFYIPYFLEKMKSHLYSSVFASTFPSYVQLSESWNEGPSLPQEIVDACTITLFNTLILSIEAKF